MAKEQYKYVEVQIPATPRNKRLTDSIQAASQTGGGGIGYPSTPQYWELVTTQEDGTALPEEQHYLRPVQGKSLVVPGDVIAFADGGEYASGLPVADYNTFGLFKAKQGGGLLFDVNEGWYVDPEFAGGGGLDIDQLQKYLNDNGYLTLSSPLTGYTKPEAYSPITATDTILSAIGKLEKNFDNYVDLTTNQTIGGVKTFNETILSKKDVIAYADGGEYASGLPVADTATYGLVKVDGTTVRINASGQLEADAGGGIDFTVGTGLDLSSASVLSVKFGTTAGTVCQGNDSRLSDARRNPYALSWSGYSTGSYDGSSAKSLTIPNNTNQLTNGAGFIVDGNKNFTSLQGSGNSGQYLAGNGRFYKIAYSELSGTPDLSIYVTLGTNQTIRAQKTYTALGWYNGVGLLKVGPSNNVHIQLGSGSGNVINGLTSAESIGNLYFNYQSGTAFTRVDASNNLVTTGDVIAYADGGSYASGLPVADQYTYGLIKYDGTTIGKNSSGQLYVINAGSGGGSNINVIDSLTSQSKTDALSANQGYQLDQRLKNVRWATPDGTDYVRVYLGSEYRDLSKNGHSHAWSTITSKPSWIGSTKPSYSWSEITNKPTVITSISVKKSGSGNAVGSLSVSGSTIYYNMTTISGGGSSWNGGTITNGITISNSGTVGISISTGTPFVKFGSKWKIQSGSDLNFYYGSGSALAYFSGSNRGNLWIAGSLVQNSDMRLKSIKSYLSNVLDSIKGLDVFRYTYNSDASGRIRIGMSAQQTIVPYPEVVYEELDGYYSMDYVSLIPIAFQGIKELYTRFLPVEDKVKALESRVQNLQLRLDNAYREIFELKQQKGGAA